MFAIEENNNEEIEQNGSNFNWSNTNNKRSIDSKKLKSVFSIKSRNEEKNYCINEKDSNSAIKINVIQRKILN